MMMMMMILKFFPFNRVVDLIKAPLFIISAISWRLRELSCLRAIIEAFPTSPLCLHSVLHAIPSDVAFLDCGAGVGYSVINYIHKSDSKSYVCSVQNDRNDATNLVTGKIVCHTQREKPCKQ